MKMFPKANKEFEKLLEYYGSTNSDGVYYLDLNPSDRLLSLRRHVNKLLDGEMMDSSGYPTVLHILWNAYFLTEKYYEKR